MYSVPTVLFSNRVEILYENLRDALFDPAKSSLFTRRLIIVPSPAMKTWLMLRMAQDPKLGFATGIKVAYLNEALDILRADLGMDRLEAYIPTSLEMSFAIEDLMRSKAEAVDPVWQPLQGYLKSCTKRKKDKRVAVLADQLAQLFVRYGTYGGSLLGEWDKQTHPEWQVRLWQELYQKYPGWITPNKKFTAGRFSSEQKDYQTHLFALSFVSRLHFTY